MRKRNILPPTTTYSFEYGNFGLRSKVEVGDRTLAEYSYTSQNNYLSSIDYGNDGSVEYKYDNKGRLIEQTYEDGDTGSTGDKRTVPLSHSMGKAGERMAKIDPKQKEPIQINGRTRIPDGMTDNVLTEVKNVKYISNTQQLRDFADYADLTKRTLELYVRPNTRIAKTVIEAGWDIKYLW